MQSELEKLVRREYRRRVTGDAVWAVAKVLFLMFLGALIFWILSYHPSG